MDSVHSIWNLVESGAKVTTKAYTAYAHNQQLLHVQLRTSPQNIQVHNTDRNGEQ